MEITSTIALCTCVRSSMDRASDFGSEGWGFESLRAHFGWLDLAFLS